MSSSFQIQVTNFMYAMACSVSSTVSTEHCETDIQDFSPPALDLSPDRIQPGQMALDLASGQYLSAWLPSVETLVAALDLTPQTNLTPHTTQRENSSIRDFGSFVAQLESPSASAFETSELNKIRTTLSERSLTFADFRHAVDHQIDYASSIWQHN